MEHPLVGDISELNLEQLGEKINLLTRRLNWSRRYNQQMAAQLSMILEAYQNQYAIKQKEAWNRERGNGPDFSDRIDIS
jgi:hypothetical protein